MKVVNITSYYLIINRISKTALKKVTLQTNKVSINKAFVHSDLCHNKTNSSCLQPSYQIRLFVLKTKNTQRKIFDQSLQKIGIKNHILVDILTSLKKLNWNDHSVQLLSCCFENRPEAFERIKAECIY